MNSAAPSEECADAIRRFDHLMSRAHPESPQARLKRLQRAARAIGEDPAGCVRERLLAQMREQQDKLVVLSVNGRPVSAAGIYSCPDVDSRLHCQGWGADDSAHLGELGPSPARLGPTDRIQLSLAAGYRPRRIDVFAAPRAKEVDSPLRLNRRSDGSLKLPGGFEPEALIVIVRDRPKASLVKYVWTLRIDPAK